jgi:hypothetical protein
VTYAGGGGSYSSGTGGTGGGGGIGVQGTSNLGGGAGGDSATFTGGSGVVIIAYPDTFPAITTISGLTYDQPTRSGYRVYRFTVGTGTITW